MWIAIDALDCLSRAPKSRLDDLAARVLATRAGADALRALAAGLDLSDGPIDYFADVREDDELSDRLACSRCATRSGERRAKGR